VFQTKFVERIKAHILCAINFFLKIVLFEIMQENMVEPDMPHCRKDVICMPND